ncbi:hypothetical protein Rhal01_02654 [Rubritalea halochordaticola]|uniref:TfoX N-terminal domain-containing protein n=1 Tax=Rubritalea halochordaticola TaxID=714537 RepID=A0ABP9V1H2_9BACT
MSKGPVIRYAAFMAFDELFADRVRCFFVEQGVPFTEKRMMGGLCILVDEKMCCGILQDKATGEDKLMARVGPEVYEKCLEDPSADYMDFTGRPIKGFLFIQGRGIRSEQQLNHWLQLCLDFNPQAKATNKK